MSPTAFVVVSVTVCISLAAVAVLAVLLWISRAQLRKARENIATKDRFIVEMQQSMLYSHEVPTVIPEPSSVFEALVTLLPDAELQAEKQGFFWVILSGENAAGEKISGDFLCSPGPNNSFLKRAQQAASSRKPLQWMIDSKRSTASRKVVFPILPPPSLKKTDQQ